MLWVFTRLAVQNPSAKHLSYKTFNGSRYDSTSFSLWVRTSIFMNIVYSEDGAAISLLTSWTDLFIVNSMFQFTSTEKKCGAIATAGSSNYGKHVTIESTCFYDNHAKADYSTFQLNLDTSLDCTGNVSLVSIWQTSSQRFTSHYRNGFIKIDSINLTDCTVSETGSSIGIHQLDSVTGITCSSSCFRQCSSNQKNFFLNGKGKKEIHRCNIIDQIALAQSQYQYSFEIWGTGNLTLQSCILLGTRLFFSINVNKNVFVHIVDCYSDDFANASQVNMLISQTRNHEGTHNPISGFVCPTPFLAGTTRRQFPEAQSLFVYLMMYL